ncbi:MAG: hypothetical protein IT235_00290 [Bacteroidia bacterium]|nr:hypothetical protein [Bacteroidia bacterium]
MRYTAFIHTFIVPNTTLVKYISFLFVVTLLACAHPVKFNNVNINNKFVLQLPEYMQPATELHSDASLQYKNEEKDIYTIVINENKTEMKHSHLKFNLDTYFKAVASQPFIESIQHGKISEPVKKQINGSTAMVAEITGDIGPNPVYYKLAVIETDSNFYQILTWTKADNLQNYSHDIDQTIDSFKELQNS